MFTANLHVVHCNHFKYPPRISLYIVMDQWEYLANEVSGRYYVSKIERLVLFTTLLEALVLCCIAQDV